MSELYQVEIKPGAGGLFKLHGEGDHDRRSAIFLDTKNDPGMLRITDHRVDVFWNAAFFTVCEDLTLEDVKANADEVAHRIEAAAKHLRLGRGLWA